MADTKSRVAPRSALVAQGIERRTPKPGVAGSIPAGGTANMGNAANARLMLEQPDLSCGVYAGYRVEVGAITKDCAWRGRGEGTPTSGPKAG